MIAARKQPHHGDDGRISRRLDISLGFLLVASGVFSLYRSAIAPQEEDLMSLWFMVFGEIQFFGGIWLLSGKYAEETRLWTVAFFAGLWICSLLRALAGKCSCEYFGSTVANPWYIVAFNLAVLVLLLKWRPSDHEAGIFDASFPQSLGLVSVVILVAAVGFWREPLIAVAGTATFDGRPLQDASLVFVRNAIAVEVRTDREGFFRLPPVRPGLYTVSFSGSPPSQEPAPDSRYPVPGSSKESRTKNLRRKPPKPSSSATQSSINAVTVRRMIDESAQKDLNVEF